MTQRGKFIVIDGMDGSGKGTQIKLLEEKLSDRPVIFTREPGGTPRAEELRAMILNTEGNASNPLCDFFLFWAARASHVEDHIAPSREAGVHVISDRYDSSTYAFQIYGEERQELLPLWRTIRGTLPSKYHPDLYIILDLDPLEAFNRRANDKTQTRSRFDTKPIEYHERVRAGFLAFAEESTTYFVDAARAPEEIHNEIWAVVRRQLGLL